MTRKRHPLIGQVVECETPLYGRRFGKVRRVQGSMFTLQLIGGELRDRHRGPKMRMQLSCIVAVQWHGKFRPLADYLQRRETINSRQRKEQ